MQASDANRCVKILKKKHSEITSWLELIDKTSPVIIELLKAVDKINAAKKLIAKGGANEKT